ncbi:MAG TPA: 50S ribosomal protein L18 [Desulfosalsimonadaceae bacterium]|nr:50S ribosomal protein L18 [Desulfosalsimonadaceae bacterium]
MGSPHIRKALRVKRKKRIRKKLAGTPERPRLCIFRSTKHIYAQIIDDTRGMTLACASTMEPEIRNGQKFDSKVAAANFIGKRIGERASEKGIKAVVFDRGGFMYHGRVKAVSDGAREAGLDF